MAAIPNSILDDTKKLLGLHADDPSFDTDVTLHITASCRSCTSSALRLSRL